MQCSDTNGELPAIHIPKEMIEFAIDLTKKIEKIKAIGGVGDTEVSMRVQPDGQIQSVKYSFSEPRNKKSA